MRVVDSHAVELRQLQKLRGQHIGRLLLRASRAFNARATEKLQARGYGGLTLAHLSLLPYLDADGTRVTTLAERAGMTKQGMGQLVLDLEHLGYAERVPDPTDRRAALVCFTEVGQRFLADAVAVTGELEAEYAAVLGEQRLADLRDTLAVLVEVERP
jgi:DNA-binding MarR family transcriptional regulator